MNELVVRPNSKNIPNPLTALINNRFILFVPIIFLLFNSKKGGESLSTSITSFLEKNKDAFTLENLNKKVTILKKVGPYMPEPTIETLNKVILNFEKISKIVALMEFVSTNKSYEPIVAIKTVNQKDKINGIFKALEDEIPQDKAKTIKPLMDIVVNFDKYKSMINLVASLANPSGNSDTKLEDIISMAIPLLSGLGSNEGEGKSEGEGEKKSEQMKDMLQMFELLTMLNSSDKKDDEQSNK